MPRYAAQTEVTSDRSKAEIERILRRYGATAFMQGWTNEAATVGFEIAGRRVLMRLPMPDRNDKRFTHTPARDALRRPEAAEREYEQAVRQRWRALALVIKAKLEAVEVGISTVEAEFLYHVALPNGQTVGEWVAPQLNAVYGSGQMPALLPGGNQR